ncbi:hypothetical protein PENSTE_c025G00380 [Penicillium steckii]|uniref:Uncharacterized protein n=1 Tax=Penicillium steckii TaxID=303698 RepID=A0A1V6SPV9_9EURO|nr:hypothetical protein PENSTE_c025G00380 [Penicillium steckii]
MENMISGQFADLREYLVKEIMNRCKQLHDQPETWQDVANFLKNFPETLHLLKHSGLEEAQILKIKPPICFEQRINRLVAIVHLLETRIEDKVLATTEVPRLLSEMCAHIGRLTIDTSEDSDYLNVMEDYAAQITNSYWADKGYSTVPRISYEESEAEAFSLWNRLNGPVFDCGCRQCASGTADQSGVLACFD